MRSTPTHQLLSYAVSTYMDLVATVSRGAGGKTHLILWTYEKAVRTSLSTLSVGGEQGAHFVCSRLQWAYPCLVASAVPRPCLVCRVTHL
jgi:hypothetical protein